jgi:hypothetical protein
MLRNAAAFAYVGADAFDRVVTVFDDNDRGAALCIRMPGARTSGMVKPAPFDG